VVTKKESGTRCTGESRGHGVKRRKAAQRHAAEREGARQSARECGRARGSVEERKGVWQSMSECGQAWQLRRGWVSARAWKVLGNRKMSNFRG
jgi:hypothetical protein